MKFLHRLIRMACAAIAKRLPARYITRDGAPYLERYYLCGPEPAYFPVPVKPRFAWLPQVYIHRFADSDHDAETHNHPWNATSLILAGGYKEERRRVVPHVDRDGYATIIPGRFIESLPVTRTFKPGQVNRIGANDFHKVTLLESDCWTLFITGEKTQSWGFWDHEIGEFIPWREHKRRRDARQERPS